MQKKLTVKFLDSVKAPATGHITISDLVCQGLRFRVLPSGKRAWIFDYRVAFTGKRRSHTIGQYPTITLEAARIAASMIAAKAALGDDVKDVEPEPEPEKLKTVGELLRLYNKRKLSALRSGVDVLSNLKRELKPVMGKPMAAVTRDDLEMIVDAKRDKGHSIAANRLRSHIMTFFKWATKERRIEINPVVEMSDPAKEESRDRLLSVDELRLIWNAVDQMGFPWCEIYRLLILTLQRRDEIANLDWSEINVTDSQVEISKHRIKNKSDHIVPLSPPALKLLVDIHTEGATGLVFGYSRSGWSKVKTRLDGILPDDMPAWRNHDIRRSVTHLASHGIGSTEIVKKILNHSTRAIDGVTAVYQRYDMLKERRETLNAWADIMLAPDTEPGDNVVELKRRG